MKTRTLILTLVTVLEELKQYNFIQQVSLSCLSLLLSLKPILKKGVSAQAARKHMQTLDCSKSPKSRLVRDTTGGCEKRNPLSKARLQFEFMPGVRALKSFAESHLVSSATLHF